MILLIDNYDSFTYNLYQYTVEIGHTVTVRRNDAISVDEIEYMNPEAIFISPGPGRPENAGNCPDIVKKMDGRVPMLGVCLGYQIMAYVYGMKIIPAPTLFHGKSSPITHDGKTIFKGLKRIVHAGRYHSLAVDERDVPDYVELSARTLTDNVLMGMRHKTNPTEGIQFHPESLLTPEGKTMIRNFFDRYLTH